MSISAPRKLGSDAAKPTRERILDAAERLFAERGYAATPVRDIAAEVSLNPASLYNHFPGKEELYEAVLERGVGPIVALLDELAISEELRRDEDAAIERIVSHFAAHPNLARLIQQDALAGGARLLSIAGRVLGPIYERGAEALAQGTSASDWEEDELPLLLAGFQNMILGYFALAPLMSITLGVDPLSDESVARQAAFLKKVARRLIVAG